MRQRGSQKESTGATSPATTKSKDSWGQATQRNLFGYGGFVHTTVFPLFLMLVTPPSIIIFWQICTFYDGSASLFVKDFSLDVFISRWPSVTQRAVTVIASFAAMQALFQIALPGKRFLGPVTITGFQPTYKLNGVLAYLLTLAIQLGLHFTDTFNSASVYDMLGEILHTLSVTSLVVCLLLYFKGIYFPSSKDSGATGNPIFDFYWGTELHPQIGSFNIKQYSNCRLGMMGWGPLLVCYLLKQYELYGFVSSSMAVSVGLQLTYILKFYYWEGGYFGTLDIMYDRLGFYIYWGVLCWIPGLYTLTGQFLVKHPNNLGVLNSTLIVVMGLVSIWANYDADIQRIKVRQADGECQVWGKKAEVIRAEYTTTDGQTRKSLLLVSGWWGVSRHIHYVPELLLALSWSLPGLVNHIVPYFYWLFLTGLLLHRLGRDEIRCSDKYGDYWRQYCERVPYRILPYIF